LCLGERPGGRGCDPIAHVVNTRDTIMETDSP
jgi:hypothetical protein